MDDADLPELLRRRLDVVARLSLATSQVQRLLQTRMAAEFDAQRCATADGAARDLQYEDLQYEHEDALRRSEEADAGVARCEALVCELETSLAEIDEEIADRTGR